MIQIVQLLLLLLISAPEFATSCTLCHFRTPPRPRPLDQYKLPTIFGGAAKNRLDLERMPKFCNASRQLPIHSECREQFEKIFCSTDLLTDSFSGCGAATTVATKEQQCSACAKQKAENMWVLKWFDSLGKPAAGITEGNYYWLGDYEMCAELRSTRTFSGQYCRIEMVIPDAGVESGCPQTDPLEIVLGVCFPQTCSVADLTRVAQAYLPYSLKVQCESESSWSLVTYFLLLCAFLWLLPQIYSTAFENHQIDSILGCFSIAENAKRTFSTRRQTAELHTVHGLEFLINFTIISGMVYNIMMPYIENVAFSYEGISDFAMHIVNNYSYQIDGLLALSAFYTTYLLFGVIQTPRHVLEYIGMRFIRFWPAYVTCVLFMYIIFPGISSGPMWIHTDTVDRCETGWWKNLLFINNWYNVTETCVDFGYVISIEAQFYVILLVVIMLSAKLPLLMQIFAYLGLIASIALSFYRAHFLALPPAPMLTLEPVELSKTHQLFDQLLLSPATRISTYCIGFIFGIGCASASEDLRQRGLAYNPHKILALLCLLTGIYPFIGAFHFANTNVYSSPIFDTIYASIHRPFWAFSLLSFVYLCHHGAFEWLNALLSWRVFAPLSKVTWITLVIAEPVILYFFSSLNKPAHATHWSTMYTSISAAFLSYFVAMCLDIFVTRPIRYLIYREQKHRYAQAHISDDNKH
ncbi:unnamed protein product [Caenorhabditis angaria]|uniref:Nose resistant-to-fluoxetine protein N-terminal domain-containing protein n=1 Tax=Caenorhabditis angaria TaxID=860376 RepID=A0A9P1IGV7_9PELO|nr:unnamed protein product [Caenorhabditis angaria]